MSVSTGEEIRLARLFDGGGNAVVVAIDHGLYNGPRPGFNDLPATVRQLTAADAILVSPGMANHVRGAFEHRGAPAMIVRLNWGTQYATQWDYRESRSVPVLSAAEAVALGADVVLVGMSIHTGSEAVDAENVEVVGRAVSQKRQAGVPIVGEVYPAGHEDLPPDERHEQIAIGCRIVAELGVDLVKTFYTGERFGEIVAATPVPVLALGSRKLPRERDALELAATAVRAGARGVVFGRNVIGARDPERFLLALREVVREGISPDEAASRHGISEAD
ncbi:MAG: class I fructose-bisphosphate aldolase [Candidatus Limnocylindrales bacterium]